MNNIRLYIYLIGRIKVCVASVDKLLAIRVVWSHIVLVLLPTAGRLFAFVDDQFCPLSWCSFAMSMVLDHLVCTVRDCCLRRGNRRSTRVRLVVLVLHLWLGLVDNVHDMRLVSVCADAFGMAIAVILGCSFVWTLLMCIICVNGLLYRTPMIGFVAHSCLRSRSMFWFFFRFSIAASLVLVLVVFVVIFIIAIVCI